jgi:hypothetical protein
MLPSKHKTHPKCSTSFLVKYSQQSTSQHATLFITKCFTFLFGLTLLEGRAGHAFRAVNLVFRNNVVFISVPYSRRVVACLSGSPEVGMRVVVDKFALGQFFSPSTSVVPSQYLSTVAPYFPSE